MLTPAYYQIRQDSGQFIGDRCVKSDIETLSEAKTILKAIQMQFPHIKEQFYIYQIY